MPLISDAYMLLVTKPAAMQTEQCAATQWLTTTSCQCQQHAQLGAHQTTTATVL